MTKKEIESKVYEIINKILGTPIEELNPNLSLVKDLSADSLAILDIMTQCEDEFQITISDEDMEDIKTIGDAVEYIYNIVGKGE